ncbi:caspase, EACC1-associated type [Nonomuraea sp. CA-141351]|uniref:caspase, EACC1-associated type n=1 Tax=Nonomuraea sp. CA-141351 TaxID=3239996 RepID=UPI003D92ACF8
MTPPSVTKSRAVLIGTSKYRCMHELPAVENNLQALQEVLHDETLWGLPPENCAVISNPQSPVEMLDPVREAVAAAKDTLLVYFAGHGLFDSTASELYLTLPGSDKNRLYTAVRYEHLRNELLDSQARHKIVILDCCHSGRALDVMSSEDDTGVMADSAATSGAYVMAASMKNAVVAGEFSAFSGELIDLIRNGDPGKPEFLTVDMLFKHARTVLREKGLPIPQNRERDFGADLPIFYNKGYNKPIKSHYGPVKSTKSLPLFGSRRELHDAGIHRPLQAGICGTAERGGAESIVVSGGYKDDRDYGSVIIYTGHGGRDPNSGKQITDQSPKHSGNAALIQNIITGLPVRVVRGAAGNPEHSPDYGYRYDGLFKVTDYWTKRSIDGPIVLQFRLEKSSDHVDGPSGTAIHQPDLGRWERISADVYADIALSDKLKQLYGYSCQVCDVVLEAPGGLRLAYTVHVKGLGLPHEGPDTLDNMLCLCSNHRDLFKYGAIVVDDNFQVISQIDDEPLGGLTVKHDVKKIYLRYHREHHVNLYPRNR